MISLEVRKTEDDKWGLFLGEALIATSKAKFDADYAREILNRWRHNEIQTDAG